MPGQPAATYFGVRVFGLQTRWGEFRPIVGVAEETRSILRIREADEKCLLLPALAERGQDADGEQSTPFVFACVLIQPKLDDVALLNIIR